jgi:acyl-CoA thioester hydrolase
MEQEDGLYIMVAEARCRYKAPARYDDELVVRTRLTGIQRRVLIFGYEIYKQRTDELIAEGETVHVITDRDGRPRTLPDKYRELLLASPKAHGTGVQSEGKIGRF